MPEKKSKGKRKWLKTGAGPKRKLNYANYLSNSDDEEDDQKKKEEEEKSL